MYFVIIRITFILSLKLLFNICLNMLFTLHNYHIFFFFFYVNIKEMTLQSQIDETYSYDIFNSNLSYSFATQWHSHVCQTLRITIYFLFLF